MSLHDRILELKQGHNDYGHNGILNAFCLRLCRRIDEQVAASDTFAKTTVSTIKSLLAEYSVGYEDKLRSAYETYSEYVIYLEMTDKGCSVERVAEADTARPDFKVTCEGGEVYVEAKVLAWLGGSRQYQRAIEDGLDASIDIEEQLVRGKRVAMSVTCISPMGFDEKDRDRARDAQDNFETFFIESILKKLDAAVKPSQFTQGPTFLLCDLGSINGVPLLKEGCALVYPAQKTCIASGVYWHIAFGKVDDRILRRIDFEGQPNVSRALARQGILIGRPELLGLIFRTKTLNGDVRYAALMAQEKFEESGDLIVQLCDYWNDENNTNAWKLLEDKGTPVLRKNEVAAGLAHKALGG